MYSRPSASQMRAPSARATTRGVVATPRATSVSRSARMRSDSVCCSIAIRPRLLLQVREDLVRGAHPFGGAALHEALEVLRAVLAGEVDVSLPHLLVAAEARVLTRLPVRVREEEVRIGKRRRQHRLAVPLLRDAGKDRLQLLQELLRERRHLRIGCVRRVRVRLPERLGDVRARIFDEDAGRARLPARDVPAALEREIAVDRAGTAVLVPDARIELQVQLRVDPRTELRDRSLLQLVEAGLAVVERPQNGEAHAEDDVVG